MQRALCWGLMLLVGAGCGGAARDAKEERIQSPSPPPSDGNTPERPAAAPSLATLYSDARRSADDIVEQYCGACHGKSVPSSPCGLRFDDTDDLVAVGLLVPLSSKDSGLIRVISEGSMPPPGVQPRPSASETDQLRAFIENPAFWSSLPPDGHSTVEANGDAQDNACRDAPEPAVDTGNAAHVG